MADPKSVVQRWFDEVWNKGREASIDEMFAAEGVAHGLGQGEADVRGPDGFKSFWRNMRAALPDVQIHIRDMVVEGERVAVRVVLEGTHAGDGLGTKATNRRVQVAGIVIVRIVDGRIVEGWNSWDQLGLLQQLGGLPSPETDRFLAR
jgi:steroid delta-isomerase-like uncharacterized protein